MFCMTSTKPKKKMGRPTKYSPELAASILLRLTEGESLRSIVKDADMPGQATVYEWLLAKPDFAEQYARARDEQADTLADEIVAIADETPETEPVYDKNGELVEMRLHSAYIQWQKNRVDARKWVASKLKPKKYGERTTITGDKENPLHIENNIDERFSAMITNLQLKLQSK
jgi:hypothetical protein